MSGYKRRSQEMAEELLGTPEERARKRVKDFTDIMWHVASYVIVNGFLWFIDLREGGVEWAYWVTLGWGIGLGFHVAYYFIGDEGTDNKRYQKYLEEERQRESQ